MSLNASQLAKSMLQAAAGVLKKEWPEIKKYAETEFKKIASDIILIERLRIEGKISTKRAKLHINIQTNASTTVLLAAEGLGILAVEKAINAARKAVRTTVNKALGFTLL